MKHSINTPPERKIQQTDSLYERFIDEELNKYSNLTTSKGYSNVIHKERQDAYLGSMVQAIRHITDWVKYRWGNRVTDTMRREPAN